MALDLDLCTAASDLSDVLRGTQDNLGIVSCSRQNSSRTISPLEDLIESNDFISASSTNSDAGQPTSSFSPACAVEMASHNKTLKTEAVNTSTTTLQGEFYGIQKIKRVMEMCRRNPELKPSLSYIALISLAIQSTPQQRMLLADIYDWIVLSFPYYAKKEKSWRNSIRHNLSLNECFVKAGRGDSGKGNFWAVHPANREDFAQGDFRRRRARRRVRKCNQELERREKDTWSDDVTMTSETTSLSSPDTYVPMVATPLPVEVIVNIFGPEVIMTKEEREQHRDNPSLDWAPTLNNCSPTQQLQTGSSSLPQTWSHQPEEVVAAVVQNGDFLDTLTVSTQVEHI